MEGSDKTKKKYCENCKKSFDYELGDDIICPFCGYNFSTGEYEVDTGKDYDAEEGDEDDF